MGSDAEWRPGPSPVVARIRARGEEPVPDLLIVELQDTLRAGRGRFFPAGPIPDVGERLREIFGDDAKLTPERASVRAKTEGRSHEELVAIARALVELDTRFDVTGARPRDPEGRALDVEWRVYTENPIAGERPANRWSFGRAVDHPGRLRYDGEARCACCGAVHVLFTTEKAYPGQERARHSFGCLRCGRAEITALGVPEAGSAEAYLADTVPWSRRRIIARGDAEADQIAHLLGRSGSRSQTVRALRLALWLVIVVFVIIRLVAHGRC